MKHAISNQSWTSSNCILTLQNKFCSCMHFKKSGFPNIHPKIVNSSFYSKLVDIENGVIWLKTCFYHRWVNWLYLCSWLFRILCVMFVRLQIRIAFLRLNTTMHSKNNQNRLADLIFIKPIVIWELKFRTKFERTQ